ncbi:hypothetical protein CLOM_g16767 [Closterium sp. NIES-68]|nr:hypothetical protein CLOM_g16767 [Closterium sp. NIES-68]
MGCGWRASNEWGAASSSLMFDYSPESIVFGTPVRVKAAIGATASAAAFGIGDSGRVVVGESPSEEAVEVAHATTATTAAIDTGAAETPATATTTAAAAEAAAAAAAAAADQASTGNGTLNAAPSFLELTARTMPQALKANGLQYEFQFLESPANFQLILYFANVEGRVKRAGDMVFDIELNGQLVFAGFDLFEQLQGKGRVGVAGMSGVGGRGDAGGGGRDLTAHAAAAPGGGGGDVTARAAAVGLAAAPAGLSPPAFPPAAAAPTAPPAAATAPPTTHLSAASPVPAPAAAASGTDIALYGQQVVMVSVNFTSVDLYTPATLLLTPAVTSRLPPVVSGIEMYEVFPAAKPTPAAEVSALRDFQQALGAPASLAGWQGSDPCNPIKWAGIQCTQTQGESESHVSGIYLGNSSLHGSISPSLANVSRLQHLWINDNDLVREIPSSLGDLGDLLTLLLQNNQLEGVVPQSLTNLTTLVQLNVANNSLTGVFPFNMTTQYIQIVATGNDLCSPQGLYNLPNCGVLPPPPSPPPSPHAPPAASPPYSPLEPSSPPSPSPANSDGNGRNVLVISLVASILVAAIASALVVWMYVRGARKRARKVGEEKEGEEKRSEAENAGAAAGGGGGGGGGDGDEGSGKEGDGYGEGSGRSRDGSGRRAVGVSRSGSREERGSEKYGDGVGLPSMPLSGPNSSSTEPLLPNGNVSEPKSIHSDRSGERGKGSLAGGGYPPSTAAATADDATAVVGAGIATTAAAVAAAAAGGAAAQNGQKSPPNVLAVDPEPFTVPPTHVQRMTLAELEEATGGFCEEHLIGAGGFGSVYRGVLANGRVVAVKRRAVDSMQGSTEFNNELKFLSKIRHPHLVALIGFCEEQGQQLLVYEFMAQGNLREHLYDRLGAPRGRLRWLQRLSIAVGAAKGIEYLHVALRPSIIHRDIKTTNILLDDSLCAKVADFGLSRLGPQDSSHVSTNVKGTAGYLDPEYYTVQQLTDRSDVFSFGVVLLELVSGRQPIDLNRPRVDWNIIDWARKHLQQGDIEAIVDPTLPPSEFLMDAMWKVVEARKHLQQGDIEAIVDPTLPPSEFLMDAMWKVAEVGILCVEPMGINRPSISEVVRELGEAVAMELSNTPVRNHFHQHHQQQHQQPQQRRHEQQEGQEGEQEEYDSEIGVEYGGEMGGDRGTGGGAGGGGAARGGGGDGGGMVGRRGYYNSTLTFSRSGTNGGDSSGGMDARDRGGRGMDRGFGRGENLNRVVPAELAMSWQGEGGEASGGMRGDGDGSGGVWMGVGGVSERVSERVSGRASERVSGEMGMCAVGRGGSGEGVVAGMGVGDWSGGSSGRHGDRAGGERGRLGGWGGGGGGEGEGEGGSTMGFRGPGRSGEMYIRRGGSSEEFKSRSGGEGSGAQGGGAQGVGPMAVSDSLMRRRREGAAYTGPIARPNLPTGGGGSGGRGREGEGGDRAGRVFWGECGGGIDDGACAPWGLHAAEESAARGHVATHPSGETALFS